MKTILLAAAIAAALPVTPAHAQSGELGAQRIAIRHADLDLRTAEGQAAFDLRLVHAAREACGTPSPTDALGRQRADACLADFRAAAAPHRDALVALARQQGERRLASR